MFKKVRGKRTMGKLSKVWKVRDETWKGNSEERWRRDKKGRGMIRR